MYRNEFYVHSFYIIKVKNDYTIISKIINVVYFMLKGYLIIIKVHKCAKLKFREMVGVQSNFAKTFI